MEASHWANGFHDDIKRLILKNNRQKGQWPIALLSAQEVHFTVVYSGCSINICWVLTQWSSGVLGWGWAVALLTIIIGVSHQTI